MITAFDDMQTTVEAIKLGAFEYICKPIDYDELLLSIRKAERMQEMDTKLDYLVTEASREWSIDNIVGRTPQMREIYKTIGMLSRSKTTVLIRGESGTGKELVARAIHYNSDQPTRALRSPSTAPHWRRACSRASSSATSAAPSPERFVTAAARSRSPAMELCSSTRSATSRPVFKSKLLRVVENREYSRVGSEKVQRTEARIIGATNRDLEEQVRWGDFAKTSTTD